MFIMLTTRSGAYISRFDDFWVHDNNDNDDTTDHFTAAHVHGVIMYVYVCMYVCMYVYESVDSITL